jgi:hypothetical protein
MRTTAAALSVDMVGFRWIIRAVRMFVRSNWIYAHIHVNLAWYILIDDIALKS